jgi:hypothetical protein
LKTPPIAVIGSFGHLFGPASAGCLYLHYRVEAVALAIERAAAVAKHEKLHR